MEKNLNEIGKALVCFHMGRGGRFNNPGHVSYNPYVKSFRELLNDDRYFINNEDENGNPLPDEDWTVTDCNGNEYLRGRSEIDADEGRINWDGEYDSDMVKRLEDCDENELRLIYDEPRHHTLFKEELLAYCCDRLQLKMIDDCDFNDGYCAVFFTDGTSENITFEKGTDVHETIEKFFDDNDIEMYSREEWFDKSEWEYDD